MATISISENLPMTLSQGDLALLKKAHRHLEHPSLAARLTNIVGTPMEIAFKLLPKDWYQKLHIVAESSIMKALEVALGSLKERRQITTPRNRFHKVLGMFSGGVGGCFGLPALLVEIPVSTTIMLRSIAEIACSQNEDIEQLETKLACLEVFALGARSAEDDAAETGYYGIRIALSLTLRNAHHHILEHGLKGEAPLLLKLVHALSSRFGIALSEKATAQAVPLIGALGGAAINVVFIQHFQDMAWSHFTMRRLERLYGQDLVRSEYDLLSKSES